MRASSKTSDPTFHLEPSLEAIIYKTAEEKLHVCFFQKTKA
jgi:hypothetical protein